MSDVRVVSSLPPGTALNRYITALVNAEGVPHMALAALDDVAMKATPHVKECFELLTRSAVTAATTTDAAWAAPLAASGIAKEAIVYLRAVSLVEQLAARAQRSPFNLKTPRLTTATALGDWVDEAAPAPAISLTFDQLPALSAKKLAAITVLTRELVRSAIPEAQAIVRSGVLGGLARKLDQSFLDPALAATTARPASVTNGGIAVTSTGSTAAAIGADLAKMVSSITTDGVALTWVMKPATAANISGALGAAVSGLPATLFSIPVISSPNSPAQVTLIDAAFVQIADAGEVAISLSEAATVQMSDSPDSPPTAATIPTSLWPLNLVGIRATRFVNWQRAHPGAVVYMPVTY